MVKKISAFLFFKERDRFMDFFNTADCRFIRSF